MGSADSAAAIRAFVEERDWARFHSPEALAKSVVIEAGELLECYQWSTEADLENVRAELADVLIYAFLLADRIGADVDEIIQQKLRVNADKYPVDRSRGRAVKYDRL